jgi:hypothetical protein
MATTVSFTFPDEYAAQITEALCATQGYRSQVPDPARPGQLMPNPQTPQQFARECIVAYCRGVLRAYQLAKAADDARSQKAVDLAALDSVPVEHTST